MDAIRRILAALCCAIVLASTTSHTAPAGEPSKHVWIPRRPVDDDQRTGHPQMVGRGAHPSDTGHYWGGYVGGGAACDGYARRVDQGTWGWDYTGIVIPKRVFLNWWQGTKSQGGASTYKTDGPRVLHHE